MQNSQGAVCSLERSGAIPLYRQIYVRLRDEIVSGARAFGSLLPTEQEISREFGVSRITARHALEELASQQFVVRKRRVGTQVIHNLPVQPIEVNVAKAVETLVTFGRKTAVTVLELGPDEAQEPVASLLRVRIGTPLTRVVRLRSLDGDPLGYSTAYLPTDIGKAMTKQKLAEFPILTLVTGTGRKIGAASQMIAATSPDHTTANKLGIDSTEPLLLVTRIFRDTRDEPLLLTRTFYRADRYQVRIDLGTNAPELD